MSRCHSTDAITLDDVGISDPCPADMPHLTSEERIRYCELCSTDVHNLSGMTEPEARAVIDSDEEMCIAYAADEQGNILFRPRRWHLLASMVSTVILSMGTQTGCGTRTATPGEAGDKGLVEKIADQAAGLFIDEASDAVKTPKVRKFRGMIAAPRTNHGKWGAKGKAKSKAIRKAVDAARARAQKAQRALSKTGAVADAVPVVWDEDACIEVEYTLDGDE
jgi:hypothetical protein